MSRQEDRPEWVKCISVDADDGLKGTFCTPGTWTMGFKLVDLEHAEACIRTENRLQPCEECLQLARAAASEMDDESIASGGGE